MYNVRYCFTHFNNIGILDWPMNRIRWQIDMIYLNISALCINYCDILTNLLSDWSHTWLSVLTENQHGNFAVTGPTDKSTQINAFILL